MGHVAELGVGIGAGWLPRIGILARWITVVDPGDLVDEGDTMHHRIVRSLLAAVILGLTVMMAWPWRRSFRGVDFPKGADCSVDAIRGVCARSTSTAALGRREPRAGAGTLQTTSRHPAELRPLGNGGSLTLRFVKNALDGSGTRRQISWIFEIGRC